jgi:diguanylate cyclase (GGDEF)-like protein/PAS domain S-box-containing protein
MTHHFNRPKNHSELIQIVDDDPAMRMLTRATLKQAGFSVIEAADGMEGLAQFRKMRPHLVMLDVVMPRMDGFAACRQLRQLPEGKDVPVLMLTGLDDVASVQKAFDAGATDFISKPINWLLLRYRVLYMLRAHRTHEELRMSQSRLSQAQRIARLGHWQMELDGGQFECCNDFPHLLGLPDTKVIDKPEALIEYVHPEDRQDVLTTYRDAIANRTSFQVSYRQLVHEEERFIHCQGEILSSSTGGSPIMTGICQDITDRKQAEQRIRRLSLFDTLTEFAKRDYFIERLEHALHQAHRKQSRLAVLRLDLDRFKHINDTLGSHNGDRILVQIASRIRHAMQRHHAPGQSHDIGDYCIARFGGDEFAILLPEIGRPEQALEIAHRISAEIARPVSLDLCEVFLTISVGISFFPADASDPESLLKNAGTAMFHAKDKGRNTCQPYSPAMENQVDNRLALENDIRKALQNDEFFLCFQPQVDMSDGHLIGAEALLRWRHPEQGIKLPGEFLPVALESGLIIDLDRWVLETACRQIAAWKTSAFSELCVSVNLSGQLFWQHNVAELVGKIVQQSGIRPRQLQIELTENTLMQKNEKTINTLKKLKELGIAIAIDDFGTGYSSLSYLKNFPVDTLKIDRSFIRDITDNASDVSITRAIIALGQSLGLAVIPEGVETEEQKTLLQELGCSHAQGFLFGRPVTADLFAQHCNAERNGAPKSPLVQSASSRTTA